MKSASRLFTALRGCIHGIKRKRVDANSRRTSETRRGTEHLAMDWWQQLRIGLVWSIVVLVGLGSVGEAVWGQPAAQLPQLPLPGNSPLGLTAATKSGSPAAEESVFPAGFDPDKMLSPQGLTPTLKIMVLMTLLSLAPSLMIMTTCFIRMIIVLGLLRQALGTQQLPPNQVLLSLSLFMTIMIMWPVWNEAYREGITPYTQTQYASTAEQQTGLQQALERSLKPIRQFMSDQIFRAGNENAVWMFIDFQRPAAGTAAAETWQDPESFDDVPTTVLIPAFMMSELKVAFIIGFQIYLPFIIIDMVVASILISMGMMMLPPVLISLPFKLLLFILVDGWYLTVEMLLQSVQPYSG